MSIQRQTRRLSAAALAIGLGILLLIGPLTRPAAAATGAPLLDTTFSTLLNTLRTTLGLGTLAVDNELSGIARNWSVKMANSGSLSHNGALTSQATGWAMLGENVGTGGAVSQIFDALVASPPHMKNMSNGQFTKIGIGTVTDGKGRLWTTHVFMRPASAGSRTTPAPTAAPAPAAPAPVPITRAPRPTPTTAAPVTAPPTTAAPVAAPTTAAPVTVPAPVAAAASAPPTEAAIPATPAMDPISSTPAPAGMPPAVLAGAGLLALLLLAGGGMLLRRARGGSSAPALPASFAAPSAARTPAPAPKPELEQDLTKVLDLLYN